MRIEWKWDASIPVAIETSITLASIACSYQSQVLFGRNGVFIDGKHASQVVSLLLTKRFDESLSVIVEGEDAGEAFGSIHAVIHPLLREPLDEAAVFRLQSHTVHPGLYIQAM